MCNTRLTRTDADGGGDYARVEVETCLEPMTSRFMNKKEFSVLTATIRLIHATFWENDALLSSVRRSEHPRLLLDCICSLIRYTKISSKCK